MSKMSELDAVIRDLRTAAAAINDAADTLTEMFSGETAEAPAKPTEPVPTKEDVRAILAEMSSRSFTAQVMAYTNSPLVSYTKLSPNHSGQRTHSIDRITPHCVVGQYSVETLGIL